MSAAVSDTSSSGGCSTAMGMTVCIFGSSTGTAGVRTGATSNSTSCGTPEALPLSCELSLETWVIGFWSIGS